MHVPADGKRSDDQADEPPKNTNDLQTNKHRRRKTQKHVFLTSTPRGVDVKPGGGGTDCPFIN